MDRKRIRYAVAALVAVAVALLLLNWVLLGDTTDERHPTDYNFSGNQTGASIDLQVTLENDEETPVTVSSNVSVTIRGYEDVHYERIRLCMYDASGTVLHGERLGDLGPTGRTYIEYYSVTATVEEIPEYVVVDHPDLRRDSRFSTELRVWVPEEGIYDLRQESLGEVQDRFDFPRSNETGTCG